MHHDHGDFIQRLAGLTLSDLDEIADAIEASMMSSAGWLEWRRAIDAADRSVRRLGLGREAGAAAHAAATAVLRALERQMDLPDARVTMVARAARDVAAALVAVAPEAEATGTILAPWRRVLERPPVAA